MAYSDTTDEEQAPETPPAKEEGEGMAGKEQETEGQDSGSVQVPEQFQKEATALVEQCETLPCLEFLSSLVNDQRKKLMSSQKKSGLMTDDFTTEGGPEGL